MAQSFQRQLTNVTSRDVAATQRPEPSDTSTADLIQTVGGAVGEQIQNVRKAEVRTELDKLGKEVFQAETGEPAQGEVAEISDRFKKLKAAKEQGTLTEAFVNIQAEKIIKQVEGKNPGFADLVRKEAAGILGFDPTGSQTRALFGVVSSKSKNQQTLFDKQMERAQVWVDTGVVESVDVAMKLISQGDMSAVQQKVVAGQKAIGAATADEVFTSHVQGVEDVLNNYAGTLRSQILSGGINPNDKQGQLALLAQSKQAAWVNLSNGLGVIPASSRAEFRAEFDAQYKNMEAMVNNGTMTKLLEEQSSALQSNLKIQGAQAWPAISLMGAINPALATEYVKMTATMQNADTMSLLERVSPGFKEIKAATGARYNEMVASTNRILGTVGQSGVDGKTVRTPTQTTPQEQEQIDTVIRSETIRTSTVPEYRDAQLETLIELGKTFQGYSFYGQPGVHGKSTPAEKSYITTNFANDYEALTSKLNSLKGEVKFKEENGSFAISSTATETIGGREVSRSPLILDLLTSFKTDLDRLNAMNKLVQSGWSTDLGVNPERFVSDTLQLIAQGEEGEKVEGASAVDRTGGQAKSVEQIPVGTTVTINDKLFVVREEGLEEVE